ncbi:MAG: hypothetical protein J6T17_01975 [Clostridia bacterium]|nr:hypothetical protein [Clostridia bacterium]
MQYIIRLKYRTGENRYSYVWVNSRGNGTNYKDKAHRFNDHNKAIQVARLLTKNTNYKGEIFSVD